jgi:hypothetical protein
MVIFTKPLQDKFDFVETKESPDFVFGHASDRQILAYSCIRIFITGENVIPDFNIVDYAIGFNEICFGDRYLRWPIYRWHQSLTEYEEQRKQAIEASPSHQRKRLCACVISNLSNRQGPLAEMCDALDDYQSTTYGGKWRNNIGGRVKDKLALLQEHKFSIAFENTAYPGYTTEKIVDAFLAGTIPIYWGDPTITQHFNSKAFIQCMEGEPIADIAQRIKKINESQELYESMLREPIFTEQAKIDLEQRRVSDFVENIFLQSREAAYRRNRSRWGIKYETMLFRTFYNPFSQLVRLPKILLGSSFKK